MHYFILIYMRCKFVPQEKTDGSTMKTNYKKTYYTSKPFSLDFDHAESG